MTNRRDFLTFAAAGCLPVPAMSSHAVVEFRNYTMQPGGRDTLIGMFEREFLDPLEAGGAQVLATFRNLDDANRWVWMRAFADMQVRADALHRFYSGPVWQARRNPANATIIDASNVLLLRPLPGFTPPEPALRPRAGATAIPTSLIVATTYQLRPCADDEFAAFHANEVMPLLREMGGAPMAAFATEHSKNSYPRLAIRENETVLLALTRFATVEEHGRFLAAQRASAAWRRAEAKIAGQLIAPVETLRLQPTPRSAIR